LLIKTESIEAGSKLECQICVVGAGAAGIPLVLALEEAQKDVILLEAGTFEETEASQELYEGVVVGSQNEKHVDYLTYSRQRFFGGTTDSWAGWCRPLAPWDLTKRDWMPMSGWPIGFDALEPWFAEAAPLLDIQPMPPASAWRRRKRRPVEFAPGSPLETHIYQFSPPTQFGPKYKDRLVGSKSTRLIVDAAVTALEPADDAGSISHVNVSTMAGKRFSVAAKQFVLACGGIENPRLLLLSRSKTPKGLGNEHDNVGRYFCDHLETGWRVERCGMFVALDPKFVGNRHRSAMYGRRNKDPVVNKVRTMGVLAPTPEACERERILPFHFELRKLDRVPPDDEGEQLLALRAALHPEVPAADWPAPSKKRPHPGVSLLNIRAEPTVDRENRVTLGHEKDSLGMNRVELRWSYRALDRRTHERAFVLLADTMGRSGLGRVRQNMDFESKNPFHQTQGGMHHMCSTRMSAGPKDGVVDKDCKVYSLQNLYLAGSSVYSSPGPSNPHWTIVALALRLAAHLKGL
jgi:choline dehydrogenase-like flavoprotein